MGTKLPRYNAGGLEPTEAHYFTVHAVCSDDLAEPCCLCRGLPILATNINSSLLPPSMSFILSLLRLI